MAMKHLNFRAKNVKILLIFRMSKNSKIIFQGVRKFLKKFLKKILGCPKIKNIFYAVQNFLEMRPFLVIF